MRQEHHGSCRALPALRCGSGGASGSEVVVSAAHRALRTLAKVFLFMAVLPGFALITLVAGTTYYRGNRDEIRRLPGGTEGLYRIAIGTAAAQCALLAFGVVAWYIRSAIFE